MSINLVLDIILILAAIWMIYSIRELGGVVGQGLTLVTIGTLILGIAHLEATLLADILHELNSTVHRIVVLVGFVLVIFGFRRITKAMG